MKFKLFCWTKALAMNPRVSFSILVFIFWFGLCFGQAEQIPATNNEVWVLRFSGPIGPVSAKYITNGVEKANDAKAECLILEMDTPGGLDESMREIIQAILQSAIPVITYVYPSGARAASAGVFITLASHVAAMAPGTNIGAAHPVAMGGKEMDEEMKEKVTNDAAAYIKSIAEKRQRNMKWAEDAVRKSVSATEKEALKLRVIDLVAGSLEELIEKLDKRKVKLDGKEIILQTASAKIKKVGMTPVQRFLYLLTN
ncbi:MAG: nodulation protein NfeD, partial [candidate division WOR-3 bacterium]|nr:nodulation protein NfeD [candidate division WOR-3 bacterium]